MDDIAARVRAICVEHLGVTADKVTDTARLVEDLGCDSLDTVELAMAIEAEFSINMDDETMERCGTFGDLVQATKVTISPLAA